VRESAHSSVAKHSGTGKIERGAEKWGSRLETVNGWRMYALDGYREMGDGLKRRR
jgi:hypothetical protein